MVPAVPPPGAAEPAPETDRIVLSPVYDDDLEPAPRRRLSRRLRNDLVAYLAAILGSLGAAVWSMQLWRASLDVPFVYSGDAVSSAAHVKATMQWGWYEYQNDLAAPVGQRYHDVPFGDHLPLFFAKIARWFTDSWPIVFNLYFLLGFPLAAVTALWFFRRCGLGRPIAVALAILFAVAPYHWMRGESHYYLSGYWPIPIAVWVALEVLRGRPVWGRRWTPPGASVLRRAAGWITGTGALVLVGLVLTATSASYYAVFAIVLIAIGGVFSLVRTLSWRRFAGAVVAGAVLAATVIGNIVGDLLYVRAQGENTTGFLRFKADAEVFALKLTSLLMPAPGHRIQALSDIRSKYDTFPLPSEQPALGLVAAVGLVITLAVAFYAMIRGLRTSDSRRVPRALSALGSQVTALSALTMLMLMLSMVGALGTLLVFVSSSLRGWNRMSILIALTCLALTGLALQWLVRRLRAPGRRPLEIGIGVLVAVVVAVVGVYDQATSWAVPRYEEARGAFTSDAAFVQQLETVAGADAMLFQSPFVPFPEAPLTGSAADSDVVKLSLHSTTLRWSGGGIKGRPESDWPMVVNELPPDAIADVVARMGFAGVVVDAGATSDGGVALTAAFTEALAAPDLVSADGRWRYFSLAEVTEDVIDRTTQTERNAFTALMVTDPRAAVADYFG